LYVSLALVHAAAALWLGLLWPLLTLPLAVAGIGSIVIRAEEAYLSRRFGRDYEEFMRQVPRWL
jgi:protein-S-isoprenylcysteine O-methyltransferase Ste14